MFECFECFRNSGSILDRLWRNNDFYMNFYLKKCLSFGRSVGRSRSRSVGRSVEIPRNPSNPWNPWIRWIKIQAQGSRIKAQGSRLKDQGSRLKDQVSKVKGSRIKDHGLCLGKNEIEEIRTWYEDSPNLHSSSSILDRFNNRTHGQNDRFWWKFDFGPCFGTNDHPRRDIKTVESSTRALQF